jgi:glycogen(starch) synthase
MRVLVYSPAFAPQVGGLESFVAQVASGLAKLDHEVVVATTTPLAAGEPSDAFPFRVIRRPSPGALLRWVRWCEVLFHANVSLRGAWPLLLVRRPWLTSHHSWYCRVDGRIAWQDRLKRFAVRASTSVAVSRALADDLGPGTRVITNPYREELFRLLPAVPRTRDLAFLGRLVSDKGVDVLFDALALIAARGIAPRLTVIGDGPERPRLAAQAERLGIAGRIDFLGTRTGEELVRRLNEHRILVVPSRYREPFGNVAVEAIACGCVVVGSAGGGLPEAIGLCGRTFPNGDAAALAGVLAELLGDPAAVARLRHDARAHLAPHRSRVVASAYSLALELARGGHRAGGRRRGGR